MSPILQTIALSKSYGDRPAVNQLSLSVEAGDIYGFVGPNGAGKTSTIRMIATLLEPDEGEIIVAGHSVRSDDRAVRQVIGYMPDFFGVYNDMKVWEYLDFFGTCYQIRRQTRAALIDDLLELVDLSHRREDMVESLSRGMKQRLSLARTLIHDPHLLILDEPASGLDPRARVEIRQLLVTLAGMGKTIFFSTHILADVAEICTRIGILEAGTLVTSGALGDLQQGSLHLRQVRLTALNPEADLLAALRDKAQLTSLKAIALPSQQGRSTVEFVFQAGDGELSGLIRSLVAEGIAVLHVVETQRDLEDVFLQVTRGLVT